MINSFYKKINKLLNQRRTKILPLNPYYHIHKMTLKNSGGLERPLLEYINEDSSLINSLLLLFALLKRVILNQQQQFFFFPTCLSQVLKMPMIRRCRLTGFLLFTLVFQHRHHLEGHFRHHMRSADEKYCRLSEEEKKIWKIRAEQLRSRSEGLAWYQADEEVQYAWSKNIRIQALHKRNNTIPLLLALCDDLEM